MNIDSIDKEVIFDLLPLCQSGLASAPSRKLVEAWLSAHPQVAAGDPRAPAADGGDETVLFARARQLRRRLRWLHSLAIAFTLLCFSSQFSFEGGRLVSARLLALDHPLPFVPVALAALLCWAGYTALKRRLD